MITTDFSVGSPCWIDIGVHDASAAKEFYGGVFGWTFQPYGQGEEEYGFFRSDGKIVAGLGPLDEGARPAWMTYFQTPDVDAAARQVRAAGGSVRREPEDVDDHCRIAQFTDPQGAEFAAWQPGKTAGLEKVDDPGSLMWVELYTNDAAAAKDFYQQLYGWSYTDMPMPDGDSGTYTIIGPSSAPQERMHGGLMEAPPEVLATAGGSPYWHPVFHTTDCDAAIAKVTELGGNVAMGPEDAEEVGRMAVCLDPFGADFVVLRPSMHQQPS